MMYIFFFFYFLRIENAEGSNHIFRRGKSFDTFPLRSNKGEEHFRGGTQTADIVDFLQRELLITKVLVRAYPGEQVQNSNNRTVASLKRFYTPSAT